MVPMPEGLKYWTADAVAECLSYGYYIENPSSLYHKLWGFLDDADNPTPLGGDGEGGTVEEPSGLLGDNDDKTPHWWGHLTAQEQQAIVKAYEDECRD